MSLRAPAPAPPFFEHGNTEIRWAHAEANLAVCMTKLGSYGFWEAFMKECTWSIVQDPQRARTHNRKKAGTAGRLDSSLTDNWRQNLEETHDKGERQEALEEAAEPTADVHQRYCGTWEEETCEE